MLLNTNKGFTKVLTLVVYGLLLSYTVKAQLSEGDIMFVSYSADGADGFSVVAINNIPANSTVYFSDNEWNALPIGSGGAFNNLSEGELTWDTGASVILAGVVINFNAVRNSSNLNYAATIGSITGTVSLNAANEVLYSFIGTNNSTPTTFLTAIANNSFSNTNGTLTNTGLTNGVNAIAIAGNEDIMVYSGSTICTPDITNCALGIANPINWSTEDGTGNQSQNNVYPDFQDDVPLVFVATGVLPISLTSFTVKSFQENKAMVEWVTETEINNNHFTIERSIDANDWEIIATLDGAGNSLHTLNYQSIDANPYFGVSYYRLKQTDFDGAYEYFPMESFKLDSKIDLKLYPNPATNEITLTGTNILYADILLINSLGKVMSIHDVNRENDRVKLDVSNLDAGIYLLKVNRGGQIITKKFKKE